MAVVLRRAGWARVVTERHPVRMAWALTVVAAVWVVARLVAPTGPVAVGWLPGLLTVVLAVGACLTAARRSDATRSVTEFWSALAAAATLVGLGTAMRAVRALRVETDAQILTAPEVAAYMCALVVVGWALLRLPLGITDTSQRWRFRLDMATVMVASALFLWYFSVRPGLGGDNDRAMLAGLAVSALALVLLFAVAKVIMTGVACVPAGSLRALGIALLVGTIGSTPEALLPASGPSTGQLVVPVTCLLAGVAASRQHRAQSATGGCRMPARRRFSVLPYSAVAASSALLLYVAVGGGRTDRVAVAGAVVVLVGLVVSRQVLAFSDNARLVGQLDLGLAALAAREQRFGALVRNSSDFISITGFEGVLTYVSPGATRMLGLDPAAWTGRRAADLVHPDDLQHMHQQFALISEEHGGTATYQARLRHVDGSWRLTECSITNLMHDPAVNGIVGNVRDITEERAFQQRLQYQADHDALTGLANRSLFQRRVRDALADQPRPATAMLLVDLNDFKILNDTLGHVAGDQMIVAVADRLRSAVPDDATVARLGGDEFAVLVTGRGDEDSVAVTARVLDTFTEPVDVFGYRTPIAASIGVALAEPGLSAEELLRRADVAMYAAKAVRDGASSRWARYTGELDRPLLDRAALEAQLRVAIDNGQLRLAYQPIVSARTGAIAGVEALVRWVHPERGLLMPAQFVPLAERSNLILDLGRWTLTEACRQASHWYRRHGNSTPGVSVNVSARQLHDPTFADHVAATLATTGLPARLLTVEITETTAVRAQSVDQIHLLRDLGVRISLDDFGTGHSSLSLLQSCPADEVKLDRSFTRTAPTAGQRSVAVAVIELAAALSLDVVAEGVETAVEADCLTALGYDRLQGYHFARPASPGDIERRIHRSRQPAAAA